MIKEEIINSQNSNESIMNKTFIASYSEESNISNNFSIKANNIQTVEVKFNYQDESIN